MTKKAVFCDICGESYDSTSDFDTVVFRSNNHFGIGKCHAVIADEATKGSFDICNTCRSQIQAVIDRLVSPKR